MSFANERDLARVAAVSLHHVAASHRSCQEIRDHVRSSRKAIARSLELLACTPVYNSVADANLDESGAGGSDLNIAA